MDHSGHGTTMDLPPFTLGRGLAWSADGFFLVACLLGLGAVRLGRVPSGAARRQVAGGADRRVRHRCAEHRLMMCTGLNDYGMVMFSVHMVQHMMISMVSPILILLGAPVTLALRALPPAGRGPQGTARDCC
ncbi:hypothetical protein GCM10023238_23520 [Streptomyces heliomycini]